MSYDDAARFHPEAGLFGMLILLRPDRETLCARRRDDAAALIVELIEVRDARDNPADADVPRLGDVCRESPATVVCLEDSATPT